MESGKIEKFSFNSKNQKKATKIIGKYPSKKSAIMPLLDMAQRQNNNYISKEIIKFIAQKLELTEVHVYEVASFYTMFNLKPVGKYLIQICGTTPCMLKGAKDIRELCKEKIGVELEEISKDYMFTIKEVECLGACVNAPVVQINDDYFENLNLAKMAEIIDDIKSGKTIKISNEASFYANSIK